MAKMFPVSYMPLSLHLFSSLKKNFSAKFFFVVFFSAFIISCHQTPSAPPTYSKDIAPIIYAHCSSCHRPGENAPFPLLTYKDVEKRSLTVEAVVDKKIMPPWPADPSYSHFLNENYLSIDEIKRIDDWAKAGAPIGDSAQIPKPPDFASGSMLGKPDLTLHIKPFLVKGDNTDRFMVMKIPYQIPRDTFLRAAEFVPGCKYLHHVNGHIICYEDGKKKDPAAGEWYLDTKDETKESVFQKMQILNDDGTNPILLLSVTNYLPGVVASVYPEGIGGFSIKKTGIIYLNDVHYGPSPENVLDTSYVNLFFEKQAPSRSTREIQLGTLGISDIVPPLMIPPDTVMTFTTKAKILQDISLLTINPHMHLLGKSFVAYAVEPGGDTIPLIRIPNWNFEWQFFYTFPKMVHIPANSTIEVHATYDNTSNNPNNPFNPPQLVEGRNGSMKATNEMLQLILTYLPYQKGDENISLKTSLDQ